MKKHRIYSLLFLLASCAFSKSEAQEDLTLSDAVQVALKQNYDIILTGKAQTVREIQNTWGEAGRYPTVSLNINQNNGILDQTNNPTSFIQALLLSNSVEGGINAGWTIFNGFKVKASKERLEQLQAQSEGTAALVVENTIQGIMLTYYAAKLQREKLALLKNVLDLSREKWEYQQTRNEFGIARTVDLLQYESAYYTDSTNLLMQELAYKNSIRNLNLLMGVSETLTWKLTDDLYVENELFDFEDLKNKMLSNSQNLKNEMINLEILNRDIDLAKSTFYPVLSFNLGASGSSSSFKIGDFDRIGGTNLNYYGNFTLNFTLFDGGKVRRGLKVLAIQDEINNIKVDQLKSKLSQELLNHYDMYYIRMDIFNLSQKAFKVAEQNLNNAKLKENSGIINSFTLRDIEMAYLSAGLEMLESSYNLIESKTNITRLTGGLVDEEVLEY